jgi:5-methyltetrahydrofolate--homocysteine methyltransferase
LKTIANSVIEGEEEKVRELVQQAITGGVSADRVLREGLIAGMNVVGERMKKHEMYLPEVLLSATAMLVGMDLLKPLLVTGGVGLGPKVVLGTVKGDIHDIGKNLVGMMLTGVGFQVVDLGKDTPAERFVQATREEEAQIVAMSALLTTTMPEMRNTIEALKAAGLREKVKVIVGGAPVSPEYAAQIGADGYARDAARAVDKVRELVGWQL